MQTTYELPPNLAADLDKLRDETERFRAGEASAIEYRSFRVPQGVYEQRQADTFMLRIRLPAGVMLPHQMRVSADVARRYGSGRIHVTTRQDIQIHDVSLDGIHPALVELFQRAGLSTKGGGGNTVRNIIACPHAGVCPREEFDVTPHTVAVTEFMIADPLSYTLPRKYKIAFSGCSEDCVAATVNDLGFIAKRNADGPGFAVYAGGGMGPRARVGQLLEEFVPVEDIHLVAEAVKRVFDKHGNRKNKHRARLRHLVAEKSFDSFKALYLDELTRLREENPSLPNLRELPRPTSPAQIRACAPAEGFDAWRGANTCPQKQAPYHLVHIAPVLGELSPDTFEKLADIVEGYGEGMIRMTPSQNLVIRWVPEEALAGLHAELAAIDLAQDRPPVLREATACTGAATCKLGICLSQGLSRAVHTAMAHADLDLDEAADVRLYMNGCPNSCGRHPIGSIALFGGARRVEDRLVPHYVLQLGGRLGEGKTRLAEGKESLPARNVPAFLVEFLRAFRKSAAYPDFDAFLDAGGRDIAHRMVAEFKHVPPFTEDRNFYYDWGAEEPFSMAGRGPGECSAGVFDLIKVDLDGARQALEEGRLFSAVHLSARALLITRGEEARDSADALRLFEEHFVEAELVDASFRPMIAAAREWSGASKGDEGFEAAREQVSALVAAVENLYENMDQSLRFQPVLQQCGAGQARPAVTKTDAGDAAGDDVVPDREADFRGVTCPLNYVKTKLLLNQMEPGQILSVLFDEVGARSVPESAERDGHTVLSVQEQADAWRLVIRKA